MRESGVWPTLPWMMPPRSGAGEDAGYLCLFQQGYRVSIPIALEVGSAHNFTLDDTSGASNTPLAYHIKVADGLWHWFCRRSSASGNTVVTGT